jgi:hypothetical protein
LVCLAALSQVRQMAAGRRVHCAGPISTSPPASSVVRVIAIDSEPHNPKYWV